MNKKLFSQILIHLLFCIFTVLFFRMNSFLRPLSYGALYKECIAGGIVLSVFYMNYFLLFPKFYEKRRFGSYVTVSLAVLAIASLVEEKLVYPQIYRIVENMNINFKRYFANQTGMIFLRDSCFFLFSFLLCIIHSLIEEKHDLYRYLNNQKHLIVAKDLQNKINVTFDYDDITHCLQIQNYTYFYLLNGKRYTRYCTMSDLSDDIGSDYCVRIARNILVMYAYIQSFDQNTVFVQTHEGITGFKITDYYKEHALSQLNSHAIGSNIIRSDVAETTAIPEGSPVESAPEKPNVEKSAQTNEIEQIEPKTVQQMLSFINEHPGCKSSDITEHFHFSLSTANRVLKQLRDEGKIIYEGSKKTGGYYVVSS